MLSVLTRIYRKYSDSYLFRLLGRIYRNGSPITNCQAELRLKKIANKKKDRDKKIKIIFICQYGQGFGKLRTVYEKMQGDERFSVNIVAVPENISNIDMTVYDFFREQYGKNVINAWQNGKWFDIRNENPDYVFIQRPYDQYLPAEYRSAEVSKYAKVCYVDYAILLIDSLKDVCLNKLFFRNVYMFFADSKNTVSYNVRRFKRSHKKGRRKTMCIGYPAFEDFINGKGDENEKSDTFKIVWTPRWTEDKKLGGSSFMKYKYKVVKLPEKIESCELIFRPHPMTFSHMIETNRMSEDEVERYLEEYKTKNNLTYDDKMDYAKTFWQSDVLFTDMSSVIVEYFLTGKPIVYCNTNAQPGELLKEILSVSYVVNTWDEAVEVLSRLAKGNDELKPDRLKKREELFGWDLHNISDRFLEEIYKDYIMQ